jgi:hypothetical protein
MWPIQVAHMAVPRLRAEVPPVWVVGGAATNGGEGRPVP